MQTIGLKPHVDGGMDLDFTVIEGIAELAQSVSIELGSTLGEWIFDTSYGLDKARIGDKPSEEIIAAEVTRVIGNEPRVKLDGTVNVELDMQVNRVAIVTFTLVEVATGEALEMEVAI